jgi:hypothetical protein
MAIEGSLAVSLRADAFNGCCVLRLGIIVVGVRVRRLIVTEV